MTSTAPTRSGRRVESLAVWTVVFLLLGLALVVAGASMYGSRNACQLQLAPCPSSSPAVSLERILFASSAIATVIGLRLVSELTRGTNGLGATMAGATMYMFGGFLIVTRELAVVGGTRLPHSIVVGYVVLAFLGQATMGWGLTRFEGLRVVAWATVVWNLGLLAVFALAIPDDMFIPIVHNVMPTAIGVALLIRLWSARENGVSVMVSTR